MSASIRASTKDGALRLAFNAPLRSSTAPDIALDALAVLEKAGFDVVLSFVSRGDDDEDYARDLRARAEALSLGDRVRFGATEGDLFDADAALLLHRFGGEPLAPALRAMEAGVAIVAFPKGGARDFFDGHPLAARARSCSGRDVAAAVHKLAIDELGRRRLSVRAKAFVATAGGSFEPA